MGSNQKEKGFSVEMFPMRCVNGVECMQKQEYTKVAGMAVQTRRRDEVLIIFISTACHGALYLSGGRERGKHDHRKRRKREDDLVRCVVVT